MPTINKHFTKKRQQIAARIIARTANFIFRERRGQRDSTPFKSSSTLRSWHGHCALVVAAGCERVLTPDVGNVFIFRSQYCCQRECREFDPHHPLLQPTQRPTVLGRVVSYHVPPIANRHAIRFTPPCHLFFDNRCDKHNQQGIKYSRRHDFIFRICHSTRNSTQDRMG